MRFFNQRIKQFILAFLSFIMAAMTLVPLAAAQNGSKDPVRLQARTCYQTCFTEGEKCLGQQGAKEPFCNTREIGCVASCKACVVSFAGCVKVADQTASFCQESFAACLEEKLDASGSRDRALIAFQGGDGLSQESAVVIEGAQDESEGISAEDLWTARHHPGWRKSAQALLSSGERAFDRIDYEAQDGHHMIWFDITGFFGK
jgi:hypothetical protein